MSLDSVVDWNPEVTVCELPLMPVALPSISRPATARAYSTYLFWLMQKPINPSTSRTAPATIIQSGYSIAESMLIGAPYFFVSASQPSGLIPSEDSQIDRSSSISRHESRNYRKGHPS